MKARRLVLAGLLLAAATALTTCTDGIFAIIESEVKVVTSTLPLTISVFDIAAPAPGGPYYVAAGGVFRGTFNAGQTLDWLPDDDSRPLNPSGSPICNAMVYFGTTLWGGFITSSGDPDLYQSTVGPDFTFAGQSPMNDPAINGKQAVLLQVANNHLFMVSTVNTSSYELDFNQTGVAWAGTPLMSGLSKPITGVSYDGANYWAASGSNVYVTSDEPPNSSSFVPPPSNPVSSGDQVNGVFSDPASGRTFLATKENGIYWTDTAGATWQNIEADQVGSNVVSYLCVAGPADSAQGSPDKYLVGSDGYGYYTLSISDESLSRFDDSTIGLFSHSVARILVDGVNVFMGTHANGLWRAKFSTVTGDLAAGEAWVHE